VKDVRAGKQFQGEILRELIAGLSVKPENCCFRQMVREINERIEPHKKN
jgi:hypothetical protein